MTPEEQQIALCEWMGWTGITNYPNGVYNKEPMGFCPYHPEFDDGQWMVLPNTNSLDVLAEMEKKLSGDSQSYYCEELIKACLGEDRGYGPDGEIEGDNFLVFTASAPQRREALLKTLGLWNP
jgi:hypothetical protein